MSDFTGPDNPYSPTARDERAFLRQAHNEVDEMLRRQSRAIRRLACEQCKRELRRGPRNTGDFGDGSGDYIGDRVPRPIQDQERTPLNVIGKAVGDYRIAS